MSPAEVSRRTDMLGGCRWEYCAQVAGALVMFGLGFEDKAVVESWWQLRSIFWWIWDCCKLIKEERR